MRRRVADLQQRVEELSQELEELKRRTVGEEGDLVDLTIHPLPDAPRDRRGPFGASAGLHLAILFLLIVASWESHPPPPRQPEVSVTFEQPRPASPLVQQPVLHTPAPAARPKAPQAQPPPAERKPIAPPPAPKEPPPPQPLPPPKRMGEQVPIPHFPVPGTVPPEEGKKGKPGPPAPEERKEEPRQLPGTPDGDRQQDLGAGGPGTAGTPLPGASPAPGRGVVSGGAIGKLEVPKLGGGGPKEGTGGGGRRRGLNLQVPVDSGAFGDFAFDDKDYDWSDYWSQMYWAIWRAWMNRLLVGMPAFDRWSFQNRAQALKGAVLIRFVIERNGSVSSITVLEPSTMRPLDESAQNALKEVILPRLPDDFTKDREGVTGRFMMEIDDLTSWKEYMKYAKNRGIF